MICQQPTASRGSSLEPVIRSVGYWSKGEQVFFASVNAEQHVLGHVPAMWTTHYAFIERNQRNRVSTDQDQCQVSSQTAQFNLLVEGWRAERGYTSSVTKILSCPSYQKIIAMGAEAIPLILNQLRIEGDDPDLWFRALEVLTGENPVPIDARGNMKRMALEWLRWGVTH